MKSKAIFCAVISVSIIGVLVANSNNDKILLEANVVALARSEAVKTKTCWYASYDMSQPQEQIIICSDQTSPSQIVDCPAHSWARKGSSDRCIP